MPSSMPDARTCGQQAGRHEDTWFGSARFPGSQVARLRTAPWWTMACRRRAPLRNFAKANRTITVLLGDVAYVCCVVARVQHARVQHVSASSGSKNYHHQAHGRTEEWTTEAKCGRGGRWVVLDCAFTGRSSDRGARERCTQSWTRHRIEHSRRALRWPERSQPERVRGTESPLLHRVWQVAVAGQPASDDLVAFPARRVTGVFPA